MAGIYDDERNGGDLNPGQQHQDAEAGRAVDPGHAHASAESLRRAEEGTADTGQSGGNDSTGGSDSKDPLSGNGLFRREAQGNPTGGAGQGKMGSLKARASKLKRGAIIGGIAGMGILIPVIAFIMFMLLALKAPHYVANVTEWQFARATRAMAKATQNVMTEEAAMKTVDDGTYARLRAKYIGMKSNTYRNLERFNGGTAVKNMQGGRTGDGRLLNYTTKPREGALGKLGLKRLTAIQVNDRSVIAPKSLFSATDKYFHPIKTAKDRIKFYQSLDDALRVYNPQMNTFVRAQAIEKIITGRLQSSLVGILASTFRGKNRLEASKEMQKEAYNNAKSQGKASSAAPDEIKKATQTAIDATDECVKDVAPKGCLERTTMNTDGLPDKAVNGVNDAFKTGAFTKATTTVIGTLNPIYSVAVPLCLIYTGSVYEPENVNNQSDAVQRTAIMYNSVDAQIKKGNRNTIVNNNGSLSDDEPTADDKERSISPEAAGAAGDKLDGPEGNGIVNSNAMARARGEQPNTLAGTGTSTQMTALGGYGTTTIFDTFLPQGVASPLNTAADKMCPAATNLWVGGAVAVANLVAIAASAVGTAGTAAAAEVGGQVALRTAVTRAMSTFTTKVAETFTTKAGAAAALSKTGAFGKTVVKSVLLIEGATYLAKLIVWYNSGAIHNGLPVGRAFADDVDNGNNQLAGTISQEAYGGRAMTYAETAQSDEEDVKTREAYNESLSTYERYFALSNANSLLTKFSYATIMNLDRGSVADFITKTGNILNPASLTSRLFGSLTSRSASAASVKTAYYGNVQMTPLSPDEEKLIDSDPTYASPSENAWRLEQSGDEMLQEIDKKYSPCMTMKIGDMITKKTDDDEPYLVRKDDGDIDPSKGICSPEQLSYNNPKYGDRVFRWRLEKYTYNTAIHTLYGIQKAGATD